MDYREDRLRMKGNWNCGQLKSSQQIVSEESGKAMQPGLRLALHLAGMTTAGHSITALIPSCVLGVSWRFSVLAGSWPVTEDGRPGVRGDGRGWRKPGN